MKDKNIFASLGEHCSIIDRKILLYANLIKIGNNIHIASNVSFITHDIIHVMPDGITPKFRERGIKEKIGCIEVGDNVFIGFNTTVFQNARIGVNVIISAGTLVNKDI